MRIRSLLSTCVIAMLAVGAMSARGAAARTALELKEGGAPVAVGSEPYVVLNLGGCGFGERVPLARNGAGKDKLTLGRTGGSGGTHCDGAKGSSTIVFSGVQEITMTAGGAATFKVSLQLDEFEEPGLTCVYGFRKLSGMFHLPGPAVVEGSAVGGLKQRESSQTGCEQSPRFTLTVSGHNSNPLETELIG